MTRCDGSCPSHVRVAFNAACTRARSSTRRMHGGCFPAHRRPGLSIKSCKGGLVIHLLDPKHPSACPLRGLSVADLADQPPKQRQAALSISLGRCVSPPVFLAVRIVEPLGCPLSLFFPSTHLTSHTHSQWLSKKSVLPTPAVSIPAASSATFS